MTPEPTPYTRTCAFYLCNRLFSIPYRLHTKRYCSKKCKRAQHYEAELAGIQRRRAAEPLACRICGSCRNLTQWSGRPARLCHPCRSDLNSLSARARQRNGRSNIAQMVAARLSKRKEQTQP